MLFIILCHFVSTLFPFALQHLNFFIIHFIISFTTKVPCSCSFLLKSLFPDCIFTRHHSTTVLQVAINPFEGVVYIPLKEFFFPPLILGPFEANITLFIVLFIFLLFNFKYFIHFYLLCLIHLSLFSSKIYTTQDIGDLDLVCSLMSTKDV